MRPGMPSSAGTPKLPIAAVKAIRLPARTEGMTIGSTMPVPIRPGGMPRMRAASIRSDGSARNAARTAMKTSGMCSMPMTSAIPPTE